jgi:GNAT superfamily N-acetyltransferase
MRATEFITEKKRRSKKIRTAFSGPGGWYGYYYGHSGEGEAGGSGGESVRENSSDESFNGIDIDMYIEGDEIMVRAIANGRELGHVLFVDEGGYLMPQDLEVDERFQGQGIAAAMYDYVKSKGYKIRRSGQQTDAGAGFWDKHRPEQNVWENFADGKVKGKSRPGRVKRAGASCNGSVTDLRQRAKNASGEKAKMYHWCANMKSGRKKNS